MYALDQYSLGHNADVVLFVICALPLCEEYFGIEKSITESVLKVQQTEC